jgi:hypothetical protein
VAEPVRLEDAVIEDPAADVRTAIEQRTHLLVLPRLLVTGTG